MKAILVSQFGGPQVLQLCELDRPTITSEQALIEVELAGVNFIDIYHRLGKYPVKTPYIPGVEGVGRIAELGSDAPSDLKVGDRVGWVMAIAGLLLIGAAGTRIFRRLRKARNGSGDK